MKKSLVSILLAAALAGCSEDAFVDPSTTNKDILNELPTFTASIESGQEQGKGSRAILDGMNINWQTGDKISIFNKSTANLQYQLKGEGGGTTGTFQAVEAPDQSSATALNARVAIYPYHEMNAATAASEGSTAASESTTGTAGTAADSYRLTYTLPATQTYTKDSFDPEAFPMLAVSETCDLAFRNASGVLKLQFTGSDKVKSITVTGNDNEFMAGHFTTTFTANGPSSNFSVTEASKVVTLDCGEAGVQLSETTPTAFHIILPPTTFTKGFTVTVNKVKGMFTTLQTNQKQSIQRNQILKMPAQNCNYAGAQLISGDSFKDKIPDDATKLTFVPGSDLTGTADELVSIGESKAAAYLIPDASTADDANDYLVVTSADEFLFHESSKSMFELKSDLKTILFNGCNTSQVTDMEYMFSGCTSLTSLDVTGFDTSLVKDMYFMFFNCSGLTTLDVSHFNTSQVKDMSCMFSNCFGLTTLDVSHFNTSQVERMTNMFLNCSSLTSLDVSGFDTSRVTRMHSMFYGCSGLTSLDVSNFDTSLVMVMTNMFFNCSGLTSLDVSGFDLSQVTDMESMFYHCSKLQKLDLSTWASLPTATKVVAESLFYSVGYNIKTGAELILHKELDFSGYTVDYMFYHAILKSIKCTPAMKNWILDNSSTNGWDEATLVPGFKWINIETNEEMN